MTCMIMRLLQQIWDRKGAWVHSLGANENLALCHYSRGCYEVDGYCGNRRRSSNEDNTILCSVCVEILVTGIMIPNAIHDKTVLLLIPQRTGVKAFSFVIELL